MTADQIVRALVKREPIANVPEPYERHATTPTCMLCDGEDPYNEGKVTHADTCPWLVAVRYVAEQDSSYRSKAPTVTSWHPTGPIEQRWAYCTRCEKRVVDCKCKSAP